MAAALALPFAAVAPAQAATTHWESHYRTFCLNGMSDGVCYYPLRIHVSVRYRATRTPLGVWATGVFVRPDSSACKVADRIYSGSVESERDGTAAAEYQFSPIRQHSMSCSTSAYVPIDHAIHHGNRMHLQVSFWVGIGGYSDHIVTIPMALCRNGGC